jgi:transposase-like protein
MAEMGRMTAAQAVDKVMSSEHADVIRASVRFMVDALMEAEVSEVIGAEFGERAPERRTTQRNGYRERTWDTRVGAIELAIPKLRSGPGYFPSFLEPRRRAEQALVAVVQEAYVNGVSTRKVDRVVEQARGAHEQGPGVGAVPAVGRAGAGIPRAAAGGRLPVSVARRQAGEGP